MKEPIWVEKREVVAAHARQLSLHGGSSGMRDETLLESALGKPRNIFAYEEGATLARLAASYAFGIARNHAFVDGNKRTALVACFGFLRFNQMTLTATREERYIAFLSSCGRRNDGEVDGGMAGTIRCSSSACSFTKVTVAQRWQFRA